MSGRRSAAATGLNGHSGRVNGNDERNDTPVSPYRVSVSRRFLIMSFTASILLAFAVGQAARILLIEGPRREALLAAQSNGQQLQRDALPPLTIMEGKEVPRTVYTSKNFDTSASTTSSSLLVRRNQEANGTKTYKENVCSGSGSCGEDKDKSEEEEEHLPAGQHLLVDMKGIDGSFLNSEERLASAMVETVAQAKLTLLSYHCHSLVPTGVSCVGVLLESHISFHTWPTMGVITLDLFTCGSGLLMPILPIIERLFGVPARPDEAVTQLWSHKMRGFRDTKKHPLQSYDLGKYLLGSVDWDMKKEIASVQTDFQHIDVYDVISHRSMAEHTLDDYRKSLLHDDSYQSQHPELYLPDRLIFLDGVMQSTRYGDAAYHEALVHPAMFAHGDPKRVAIIGGGEGATLREVLKHKTVEKVIMVEIDEKMVNVSRQYLPDWNDCSNLVGSADMCGDDPRATLYYEDALAWFIDRFYIPEGEEKANAKGLADAEKFDVLIIDALDPEDEVVFADALYDNIVFMEALYNSLSDDGVLVMQSGELDESDDPPDSTTLINKNRVNIDMHLNNVGFESMHSYHESHAGFLAPWTFMVAFKKYGTRMNWYANEAEVELAIHDRAMRTKSGQSPFQYFDGATMLSYQYPHRSEENVYCRKEPMPQECHYLRGFNPEQPNAPISSFDVNMSGAGEVAGRGVFAKMDIAEDTYLAIDDAVEFVHFMPSTVELITELIEEDYDGTEALYVVDYYMHGYGFMLELHGNSEVVVDSGIMTFVNHGCKGTYNVGADDTVHTEFTVDLEHMPESLSGKLRLPLSPVVDRHLRQQISTDEFSRNVAAGEELLANYLGFVGSKEWWKVDVLALREQCIGNATGDVTEYEDEQNK